MLKYCNKSILQCLDFVNMCKNMIVEFLIGASLSEPYINGTLSPIYCIPMVRRT